MAFILIRSKTRRRQTCCFSALVISFCLLLTLCLLSPKEASCGQVTLAWDPVTSPDLAGYTVYWATVSNNYSFNADAGNQRTYTVRGLTEGVTYYFAVTAYDFEYNQSTYSNEVSYTLPPPGTNILNYVGCFADDSNRALPDKLSPGGETVESCVQKAAVSGYVYAGVQHYGECWGGNTLEYQKVPDSQCNTPCNANPSEMCGADWRNSIYQTPAHPSNYTLSLSKAGTGTGTVTSDPAGINCESTCSANYASGTQVTLTATRGSISTFAGWSGACSGTGICSVTMDAAKLVTATFNMQVTNYVGCFTDASNRALPAKLSSGGETVESCVQKAAASGYLYAGVQYYGECWGGNTLGYQKVPDSQCNTPCNANPSEMCGASWRNSIYYRSATP